MSSRFEIDPLAMTDFETAYRWYEAQRTGLGDEFTIELGHAFDRCRSGPDSFEAVGRQAHRIALNRFPYNVVYRYDGFAVLIVAVYHNKRHPRVWRSRL